MSMLASDLRVLIVADDPLVRAGVATLVSAQPGCVVVGQIAGDATVLAGLDVYCPDVVVWDVGWERPKHPERLADLRDAGCPVVALLHDDSQAAAAWTAGARGLLLRHVETEKLGVSLQAVTQGLVVCDEALAPPLLPTRHLSQTPLVDALTPRELEVLQLVAEGLPNKTIADRLYISEHTVKFHLNAAMSKLGARSRTEAVVRATRLGLLLL